MAEQSILWPTNGTGDGAADITSTQWLNAFSMLFLRDNNTEGVAPGYLNALAVSSTGANNARVASGGGLVRGFVYQNSTNVDLTIPSPAADTGFRIVARADWALQTVRAAYVLNTTGVTDPPALTQVFGTTWEISLATGVISALGAITGPTDARTFMHYNTMVSTTMLEADSVTNAKIADDAVDTAQIADNAITVSQMANDSVNTNEIVNLAVTTGKIADDAVTTDKIDDEAVDDTKAGNRVVAFTRRQGGNATQWGTAGTTDYTPSLVLMQAGVITVSVADGDVVGETTVTFPIAYGVSPIVFGSTRSFSGPDLEYFNVEITSGTTAATVRAIRNNVADTTGAYTVTIQWLAIGPR